MAVTRYTGTDDILPGMHSTLVARDDMVNGKLVSILAAVLAGIVVATEHLEPGQLSLGAGTLDYMGETYYGRHLEDSAGSMNESGAVFQHLSLAAANQYQCSPCAADIKRLIVLIEDEDWKINHLRLP